MRGFQLSKTISVINNKVMAQLTVMCKDKDLSVLEYRFVHSLIDNEGITQDKLTEIIDVNKSVTARTLSSLLEKECIYREDDIKDKRAKKVYLTNKGKDYAFEFRELITKFDEQLFDTFSLLEQQNLLFSLKRINNNINKIAKKDKK